MSGAIRIAVTAIALAALIGACGGNTQAPPATTTTTSPAPGSATTTQATTPPRTTTTVKTTPTTAQQGPAAGTTFAGEGMSAHDADALQDSVDQGHQPWRIDAASVAATFVLTRFGWNNPDVALADPHTAEVTNPADGRVVSLQLRQPAHEGAGGIWVVDSGVWIK
ncbi:hypothetical protein [Amycolatopsis acididurans]|uniref:hypothetical protein n=1 Tax=Amycolatopsis acididurans TaxID=2724524 RepID=UPI001B338892|nr:hypothetical protein [Amycolatopsis acididurans]